MKARKKVNIGCHFLSFFLSLIKHPENHLNNMKQKYGIFAVMKLIFSLFLL